MRLLFCLIENERKNESFWMFIGKEGLSEKKVRSLDFS